MPVFSYNVNSAAGPREGTITADSPRHARSQLRAQGYRIRHVEEIDQPRTNRHKLSLRLFGQRPETQVATVARDLATLLSIGVPLLEAIDTVMDQQPPRMRLSLLTLRDRIATGSSLADAMGEQPTIYSPLAVQMVRVGEGAGSLDGVLRQLSEFQARASELRDRVLSAITYPAFVFTAAVLVSVFLMTVIVPTLLNGLAEAGRPLPWPTLVLKFLSDSLTQYGYVFALLAILAGIGFVWTFVSEDGRERWQRVFLRVPLLGEMSRKQAISQSAMMISYLMRSGLEFVPAVELAADSLGHIPLRKAFQQGLISVRAGGSITDSLAASNMFPPVALHVFGVGQESGQLDEMLAQLAEDYDKQVTTLSNRLATAIEPVLIVALSVFVGFILFATILPILEAGRIV